MFLGRLQTANRGKSILLNPECEFETRNILKPFSNIVVKPNENLKSISVISSSIFTSPVVVEKLSCGK